jgi:hypothetical protein
MPDGTPPAHGSSDRPADARFPEIAARIGEDPARFLYHRGDALGTQTIGDTAGLKLAEARIRGIDSRAVAGAWQGVARRLHEEGYLSETALKLVEERLAERIAWLEDHGDRPERIERQERRAVDESVIAAKRERDPYEDHRSSSAAAKISRMRADGGEE